jgi:hypothetical protein
MVTLSHLRRLHGAGVRGVDAAEEIVDEILKYRSIAP